MGKFIEEFYYGNIDPQARSTQAGTLCAKVPIKSRRFSCGFALWGLTAPNPPKK